MEEELQQIEAWKDQLIVYLAENGLRLGIALLIVFVGFWLGNAISRLIHKACGKRKIAIYHALKEARINIPFPQRDVHLIDPTKS